MIRLHYYPGNASMTPHILLRELGLPFELVRVDREHAAHKSAAYLALNPNGLIPVLEEGPLVLYETGAICLHLVERHGRGRLAPPIGSDERAHFLKWLVWLGNTPQVALMHYFYPQRVVDEADAAAMAQVRRRAEERVGECLQQIDDQLARSGGPWLLGDAYTAVDPYTFMLGRWTRAFASRPARDYPHVGPYLQRMLAREAVRTVMSDEGLAAPLV